MTRTVHVGDRQGRGDPPAFHTRTHRVTCTHESHPCDRRWIGEVFGFLAAAALACLAVYVILWPKV